MAYQSEIAGLFEKVAPVLTGRPCVVRIRKPATKHLSGEAQILAGVGFLDVDPHLSEAGQLWVFLHEAGHIRAGHAGAADPQAPPESRPLAPRGEWETAANRWAATWSGYPDQHYQQFHPAHGDVIRKLMTLAFWPGGFKVLPEVKR